MPARRILDNEEHLAVIGTVRDVVTTRLAPQVAQIEEAGQFPQDAFRTLGEIGVLGMAYPEQFGGAGMPAQLYLQTLEEIAAVWASVAVGISVHTLSCFPLATFGTPEQQQRWLPEMLGGTQVGAYSLSEAHAGSDPAAMAMRARRDGDSYVLNGSKAWVTNGGFADFYTVMARTSGEPGDGKGISCFLVPADTPGFAAEPPERKMGLTGSPTAALTFDDVRIPVDRRIGEEGQGLKIALAALDSGRLGISACATGLAQGALDAAVDYAQERETFGQPIIEHQGLAFLLADMEAAVASSRGDDARRRTPEGPRGAVRQGGLRGQTHRHGQRHAGHDRCGAGPRWCGVHPRLPGGALHAGGQDHADLRGHQPDPADGHRPAPAPGQPRSAAFIPHMKWTPPPGAVEEEHRNTPGTPVS